MTLDPHVHLLEEDSRQFLKVHANIGFDLCNIFNLAEGRTAQLVRYKFV
jgi:hypothetical protein